MKAKHGYKFLILLLILTVVAAFTVGCKKNEEADYSTYDITAEVDTKSYTVAATCKIDYVNSTGVELDEVWFHLYPAAYRNGARYSPVSESETASAYPNGISYGEFTVESVSGEYEIGGLDEDILMVKLGKSIMPTQHASVTVKYTIKLPNIRHRLGYSDGIINLGNWFPIECVYDGGFTSEPYYSDGDPFDLPVCNYNVSITAPKSYTVATSGVAKRTEDGDTATTVSTVNKARDFAAVIGEFETVKDKAGGAEVIYYYTSDDDAQAHLKAACDSLEYFGKNFYGYPYKSYSVVQTAFNQGGMEYSGLVYVNNELNSNMITEVIIHETAHQWWYSIVGNDQVKEAWLDEALAEFSTTLFYKAHPEYGATYEARIADAMSGYTLYCELYKPQDTSMDRKLGNYDSAADYTYSTYVKGQILYDSIYKLIGEKAFIGGLKNYANKNAYKTAIADDLIVALEESSKRELKPIFTGFLDGSVKLYSIN